MIRAVDLVIYCDRDGPFSGSALCAVVDEAIQHRRRVLVVLRWADPRGRRRVRQGLAQAPLAPGQLSIIINAEVACVDGVARVEAVVVRYRRTGRLRAVNAAAFVTVVSGPGA